MHVNSCHLCHFDDTTQLHLELIVNTSCRQSSSLCTGIFPQPRTLCLAHRRQRKVGNLVCLNPSRFLFYLVCPHLLVIKRSLGVGRRH